MKKNKKCIIIILMVIILVGFLFVINKENIIKQLEEAKIALYGEPINIETGLINNQYFGLTEEDARQNTNGINAAIVYANKNNINYIKLEKGNYKIKLDSNQKGLLLASNVTLDLNGSTLELEKNDSPIYRAIFIRNVDNVKICNGKIIGDKESHIFSNTTTSHQWGYGIQIRGSTNITIEGLEISDFTGDGIYIDKYKENIECSSCNITINNNIIHNCRRQGITVIDGSDITIFSNEIYQISGANPAAGINLEANTLDEKIDNIMIKSNKIYNLGRNVAIQCYNGVYEIGIEENEIIGTIQINDAKEEIRITNNNLKNGEILSFLTENSYEEMNIINKITIKGNRLNEYQINIKDVIESEIEDNQKL